MRLRLKLLVVALATYAFLQEPACAQDVRGVAVLDNQIAILAGAGEAPVTVTYDDAVKSLPVWSGDGNHIAYIEKRPDATDLAKLVVIDTQGQRVSTAPIKSITPGEVRSGMRRVESVEWITPSRVVVAGGVNPTTTEYNIVDLSTGRTVREFFDDGSGASFSPDGRHYAYVTGAPHFTPPSEQRPTLEIDGTSISVPANSPVQFADVPVWSPDSRTLAVLVKYSDSRGYGVAIMHPSQMVASLTKLPFEDSVPASMYWVGSNLYVTHRVPDLHPAKAVMGKRQFKTETYRLTEGPKPWSLLAEGQAPADPVVTAKELRQKLRATRGVPQASEYNFWCSDCELSILPRRNRAAE